MAQPNEKLAASLAVLKELQDDGRSVFRSSELTRTHRDRLITNGFLREVVKGWLIPSSPDSLLGDSTPWYASFWEFCAGYCSKRFGDDWHLSPEQSLMYHAGTSVVPKQVVVYALRGSQNSIDLPFDTSLYDLKVNEMPPNLVDVDGLRLHSQEAALVRVPDQFFHRYSLEAQIVLGQVGDPSQLLRILLSGGHTRAAGRIAGALRAVGKPDQSDAILAGMKAASFDVRERNPFAPERKPVVLSTTHTAVSNRLMILWETHRELVVERFPVAPGLPASAVEFLDRVEDLYKADAYHSLSIEGYRVSAELIERVASGNWSPDSSDADHEDRNALAARGYWQAFRSVKSDVTTILSGSAAGALVRRTHRDWYTQLFQPFVTAGILSAELLAGYRNSPVYLRGSRFVPPRNSAIPDAMATLFDLLENEPEPSVRAVLGHWLFGFVHPYNDGNGRMARFLMNAMLASGGYPWTIVQVNSRDQYLAALDSASIDNNIQPFVDFIAQQMNDEPMGLPDSHISSGS